MSQTVQDDELTGESGTVGDLTPTGEFTMSAITHYLTRSDPTIRRWIRMKRMPAPHRLAGRELRWKADDIYKWVEAGFPQCG